LAERLAAVIPPDAWTPTAVHAWWELHHLSMAEIESIPHDAAPVRNAARRCWPNLERRALTPATAAK
jgi:hypothetical protein